MFIDSVVSVRLQDLSGEGWGRGGAWMGVVATPDDAVHGNTTTANDIDVE